MFVLPPTPVASVDASAMLSTNIRHTLPLTSCTSDNLMESSCRVRARLANFGELSRITVGPALGWLCHIAARCPTYSRFSNVLDRGKSQTRGYPPTLLFRCSTFPAFFTSHSPTLATLAFPTRPTSALRPGEPLNSRRSFCSATSSKSVEGEFDTEFQQRISTSTELRTNSIDSVPIQGYASGQ